MAAPDGPGDRDSPSPPGSESGFSRDAGWGGELAMHSEESQPRGHRPTPAPAWEVPGLLGVETGRDPGPVIPLLLQKILPVVKQ